MVGCDYLTSQWDAFILEFWGSLLFIQRGSKMMSYGLLRNWYSLWMLQYDKSWCSNVIGSSKRQRAAASKYSHLPFLMLSESDISCSRLEFPIRIFIWSWWWCQVLGKTPQGWLVVYVHAISPELSQSISVRWLPDYSGATVSPAPHSICINNPR